MKVILKDKTEIQNASVGIANGFLELTVDKDFGVANIGKFMDPEIMSEIHFYSGVWKTVYTGFGHLDHIDNPRSNEMRVWMAGSSEARVGDPIPIVDAQYVPKGGELNNG